MPSFLKMKSEDLNVIRVLILEMVAPEKKRLVDFFLLAVRRCFGAGFLVRARVIGQETDRSLIASQHVDAQIFENRPLFQTILAFYKGQSCHRFVDELFRFLPGCRESLVAFNQFRHICKTVCSRLGICKN